MANTTLIAAPDGMAQLEESYEVIFSHLQQTEEQLEETVEQLEHSHKDLGEATKGLEVTSRELKSTVGYIRKITKDNAEQAIHTYTRLIAKRNRDIAGAKECKKQQLRNYNLYHKAIKAVGEQQSGEVDQCVGNIYCDGHDWLTNSIALWEEEVKILKDGICKLELLVLDT